MQLTAAAGASTGGYAVTETVTGSDTGLSAELVRQHKNVMDGLAWRSNVAAKHVESDTEKVRQAYQHLNDTRAPEAVGHRPWLTDPEELRWLLPWVKSELRNLGAPSDVDGETARKRLDELRGAGESWTRTPTPKRAALVAQAILNQTQPVRLPGGAKKKSTTR
ncbi:hypothetical protein ACIOWI_37730, partial [Streptomyces sp. NPDC087659]|uniref:hypothetical protein n=1 Tax=Streptomyces sp. NPDC087659 TaxID=3365801 RepID=UPI0038299B05